MGMAPPYIRRATARAARPPDEMSQATILRRLCCSAHDPDFHSHSMRSIF